MVACTPPHTSHSIALAYSKPMVACTPPYTSHWLIVSHRSERMVACTPPHTAYQWCYETWVGATHVRDIASIQISIWLQYRLYIFCQLGRVFNISNQFVITRALHFAQPRCTTTPTVLSSKRHYHIGSQSII